MAIAFLGAAFVQARAGNLIAVAAGVSAIGAVASAAFAMLDTRTRNLVRIGEVALLNLEEKRTSDGADSDLELVAASHAARPSPLLSYRIIIQGLQIFVGVVFAAAFVLAIAVR
ncbi:hypothetical protein [Amycolatopsis sp. cg9]|uniref:hypothetical protein n=1 Tax=Amycolatopsis sp. cg9 TaxID=3238801 RepID=UPI0035238131